MNRNDDADDARGRRNNDVHRFALDSAKLTEGLADAALQTYTADDGVGLAHIAYWTLKSDDPAYEALPPEEGAKVAKIQANLLHSVQFAPTQIVPGVEAWGVLETGGRRQRVVLKAPEGWNGDLVVLGTPGLRNEFANEAIFAPWLLDAGYALVSGDKGLPAGPASIFSGTHPSQHWGAMMLDLARWARERLADASGGTVRRIYAAGLSNGGYQTRRALELDGESVDADHPRLFDGGLDWAGAYWPDARALGIEGPDDPDAVAAWSRFNTLLTATDRAALTMGWAYGPDTLTTPENFAADPPFPAAHEAMQSVGFPPESAICWGYYNTIFDDYKTVSPEMRGVGFYNFTSYAYRADLRGDDAEAAAAYSCHADPENPDVPPPVYEWLRRRPDGDWNAESVAWALKNATTGRFSAPMISLAGEADGLLGLHAHADAYRSAVADRGNAALHRLYTIRNAGHVDSLADGLGDYDFNGVPGDEGVRDRLTPMQAYVQRAFRYLVDWVERGEAPPESRTIPTDPKNDVTDPEALDFAAIPAARL